MKARSVWWEHLRKPARRKWRRPADSGPYRPLIGTVFLFVLIIYFGIRMRGLSGYLKTLTEPFWVMIPLNVVEQITRTFSLVVRLFGNVMSGIFVSRGPCSSVSR